MSDMLKRFQESTKPHVKAGREILAQAVNFFDKLNQTQTEFTVNANDRANQRGNDTKNTDFTQAALDHYAEELKTAQASKLGAYVPIEPGIQLNRWNPQAGYIDGNQTDLGAQGSQPR